MKLESKTLDNGLRLTTSYLKGTSFVDIVIAVRAGSRYEHPTQNGISHFVEHLLFRGSKSYPSSYFLNQALETLGFGLEGGTGREHTLYAITILSEHLEKCLGILGDLFRAPMLADVETEKSIIYEEILEELDENGEDADSDNISRSMIFGEHPLGKPILGRKATLESVTPEDVRTFYEDFYQPDNMVIVAIGDVDRREFFKLAEAAFGTMANGLPQEKPYLSDEEPDDAGRKFPKIRELEPAGKLPSGEAGPLLLFREKAASQLSMVLSFITEGARSPYHLAQVALERLLDDGLSSRLQRNLCERRGLLYDISVDLDSFTDIGVMDFSFRVYEKKARMALQEVFRELRTLKLQTIDAQEMDKLRGRMLLDAIQTSESSRGLAVRAAERELLGLPVPLGLEEWKEKIDALTPSDLQAAARRIFAPERLVAIVEGELPEVDEGDVSQIFQLGLTQGF